MLGHVLSVARNQYVLTRLEEITDTLPVIRDEAGTRACRLEDPG